MGKEKEREGMCSIRVLDKVSHRYPRHVTTLPSCPPSIFPQFKTPPLSILGDTVHQTVSTCRRCRRERVCVCVMPLQGFLRCELEHVGISL